MIRVKIIVSIVVLSNIISLQGMLTGYRTYRAGLQQPLKQGTALQKIPQNKIPLQKIPQKRTYYTPEKLKGLYTNLPQEARSLSPIHGVAKSASGALIKMHQVESNNPATSIKLVQKLFHKEGEQLRPSRHITNVTSALSPGILGLILGAAQKNQLEDKDTRAYVNYEWLTEYEKIVTQTKRSDGTVRSVKEVKKLMGKAQPQIDEIWNDFISEYQQDANSARSILLAFLADTADLTADHDMIDYLSGVNKFVTVFEPKDTTFFGRLKSFATAAKNMFGRSAQKSYTSKDYERLRSMLQGTPASDVVTVASDNFELAISTLLDQNRLKSFYPPQVIRSSYGYKEQHPRSNCVETAMQDLFNILLYNHDTQTFDLSLLPATLSLNAAFKKFYQDYSSSNVVNKSEVGQAFMNLVSDVPGVKYFLGKNYEMSGDSDNFLVLCNYLFGTTAADLSQLGSLLSDERRTVTFVLNPPDKKGVTTITMIIKNNATQKVLTADLGFTPGHGEIIVPNRTGSTTPLLHPLFLAKNYSISQEAQSLLAVEPLSANVISDQVQEKVPASLYYLFNAPGDWDKQKIINHVLEFNTDNREAVDYAYSLCKKLDTDAAVEVFTKVMKTGIWKSDSNFNNWRLELQERMFNDKSIRNRNKVGIIQDILEYNKDDERDIDYAYKLYRQIPVDEQDIVLISIMKSEIWRTNEKFKECVLERPSAALIAASEAEVFNFDLIIDLYKKVDKSADRDELIANALKIAVALHMLEDNFIEQLYKNIVDDEYKNKFLSDLLSACARASSEMGKEPGLFDFSFVVSEAKKLIVEGADIQAISTLIKIKPLSAAVQMGSEALVQLLLDQGALINEIQAIAYAYQLFKWETTPTLTGPVLYVAVANGDKAMTEFLLKKGANPNFEVILKDGKKETALFNALRREDINMVELLLEHKVDPNMSFKTSRYHGRPEYVTYPLNYAVWYGNPQPELIDLLIKHGANINKVDGDGKTPMDYCEDPRIEKVLWAAAGRTAKQLPVQKMSAEQIEKE